jgi:hypothetical protein
MKWFFNTDFKEFIMSYLKKITPEYDPWEAYNDIKEYGKPQLTNIEFTTN